MATVYAALTIGATILTAQYWGKGDTAAVEAVLAYVTLLSVAISAVFFLFAFFAPSLLMRIFTPATSWAGARWTARRYAAKSW